MTRLRVKALKDIECKGAFGWPCLPRHSVFNLTPRWCLGGVWNVLVDGVELELTDDRILDPDIEILEEID